MMTVLAAAWVLGVAWTPPLWACQSAPRDGVDMKKPKEGCPCPPVHVPDCPGDGLWCPPWWCTPEEPGFPERDPRPAPFPLTLTAAWFMPHDRLSNVSSVGLTGSTTGSRTTPLRFLSSLPGSRGSGIFGSGGGGSSVTGSSSAPLFGPEVDVPLPGETVAWMPFEAAAQGYARVLLGDLEIEGESTAVQDYALGIRLIVPLWRPPDFTLSPYISAGPAYLRTEFGHVTGIEVALGLRTDVRLARSVALIVQVELNTFSSSDFFSWGPAGTAGLTVGF